MKRILMASMIVNLVAAAPVLAQRKATIQNVPEIQFSSYAEFSEASAGSSHLGESVAGGDEFQRARFCVSPLRQYAAVRIRSDGQVREGNLGSGYIGFEFAHSVRVDKDDNIWTVDEGTNMVTKFSPEGRVLMVLGRRPLAVAGMLPAPPGPNVPCAKICLLPSDGCGLGPAGQHLHLRWLLQQPGGEV